MLRIPRAAFHTSMTSLSYPVAKSGRPIPAYIVFANEQRAHVQSKFPELKVTEVGRKLGELWRELPDAERERRVQEYRDAIEEFKRNQPN